MCDFPDILLHQLAGNHDLMPAASAFQAKIRPYPQHFPLLRAAGMLFLQFYDIAYLNIHFIPTSLP